MSDWVPDAVAAKFGGMISRVSKVKGGFECVVHDLGPNVIACGSGSTPEEAIADVKKVAWGYQLRMDFMDGIPEERRLQIAAWLWTLTSDQKTMICELMDERERWLRNFRSPR